MQTGKYYPHQYFLNSNSLLSPVEESLCLIKHLSWGKTDVKKKYVNVLIYCTESKI